MKPKIEFTIEGSIPSKDNLYKISKGRLYKDKAVKEYENSFFCQVPIKARKLIDKPVVVDLKLYYPSRRADVINAWKILGDCLQSSNVIKNDRLIECGSFKRFIDIENPRVEITIKLRK